MGFFARRLSLVNFLHQQPDHPRVTGRNSRQHKQTRQQQLVVALFVLNCGMGRFWLNTNFNISAAKFFWAAA
jgi:hypothetical protein